ncbi:MAG: PHP domain-containing protein [Chloroflexota bacterium]
MTTPRRNSVDLHCHTVRSDGVLEPRSLYAQMRAWGSTLVAITDHDTLSGVRELRDAGLGSPDGDGPRIIAGVEINTRVDEEIVAIGGDAERIGELHVLGFGVDPDDEDFERTLASQREGRSQRLERTLERLEQLGIDVRSDLPDTPGGIDSLGRPHVARALVASGHAESVNDAFRRYLEPGAPGYVQREGIGPRSAIEAITAAGGIASLAHPPWAPDQSAVIAQLIDWGLRGLEVYYHHFDDATVERMAAFAQEQGLLPTGGSDYHGDIMDYATAQHSTYVPAEVGERLIHAIRRG